jgi:hypothetical protein
MHKADDAAISLQYLVYTRNNYETCYGTKWFDSIFYSVNKISRWLKTDDTACRRQNADYIPELQYFSSFLERLMISGKSSSSCSVRIWRFLALCRRRRQHTSITRIKSRAPNTPNTTPSMSPVEEGSVGLGVVYWMTPHLDTSEK